MKRLKSFFYILLAAGCIYPLYRFCHHQTDGFTPRKIRKAFVDQSLPHLSSSASDLEMEEVKKILGQPLTYIGRGGQCYAFATSDKQYVIKLLKYNNNYPRIWFRLVPFPFGFESYRKAQISRKVEKLKKEYESYRIALRDLKQETGILYMHFDKGSLPGIQLKVSDKINIHHELSADTFQFYIQKKGTPLYPGFKKMIKAGKIEEAQKALDELSSYLIRRCEKKITDKDNGIWRNFAFDEGHPFQIDIGQFIDDPSLTSEQAYQKNLLFFTRDFRSWLETLNPSLAEHFTKSITLAEPPL